MIKDEISPAVRHLGLRGSAGRYVLPSETHWALVGFQKSAYSDALEIQFTINLTAISFAVWESMVKQRPHLGKRPKPSVVYGDWAPQTRIGPLLPDPADKWWRVRQGRPTTPVAEDAMSDLAIYGLPWLRSRIEP